MANLTLSLDDDLLQKAREAAARDRTSVNALVRDYLASYVNARGRRLEALDAFEQVAERSQSRSETAWSRDELNRRWSCGFFRHEALGLPAGPPR